MALGGGREFVLKIVADVKDATKGLEKVEQTSGTMKDKVLGVGAAVAGGLAVGAVVQFGRATVSAASEAQQSMGAMSSVFGSFAGDMEKFGETTAENLGITTQEFNQLSAVTGSLLKNAGLPMEQVTQSTQDLTTRAADLAAMFGTDVPSAVDAMGSAFKGEFDSLEKFGVSLKASEVEARAMAKGYVDAEGKVTDAGKAIATQELIMEQSADAAGTFADESGTLAGQTAIMTAKMSDAQAEMGSKLLPVIVKLMDAMMPVVDIFLKYADVLIPIAGFILGIVVAVKAYQLAQAASTVATTAWTAAQWLFNAAMTANPIGLVVLAIGALIAAVVLAYQKVDWFREGVDAAIDGVVAAFNWMLDAVQVVWEWIKKNWPLLLAIITGPFGLAVYAIQKNWDSIKGFASGAVTAITGFVKNIWQTVSDPFKRAAEIISTAFDSVLEFFRTLPTKVNGFFNGFTNIIKYPFEQAFAAIKRLWNSTVGGFGFSVPSWIPGVGGKSFKIPKMATGGVVTRPTIALIGEAGPEAVVPLNKAGLGGVTINVYALTASSEVGRQVWNALREYERTSGKQLVQA